MFIESSYTKKYFSIMVGSFTTGYNSNFNITIKGNLILPF